MPVIELSAKSILLKEAAGSNLSMWPFRLFAGLYVTAFSILIEQGYRSDAVRTFRYLLMFAALAFVTSLIIKGGRKTAEAAQSGHHLRLQFVLCAGAILITGIVSAVFGSEDDEPLGALSRIYTSGCWQYVIEVFVVFFGLRALGVRARDLGLTRPAARSLWIALLWLLTAIGFLTSDVMFGVVGAGQAAIDVVQNLFRNGFSEEFLFRGVLFSRLRLVLADEWALLLQALLFGFWHYGADIRAAQGNLLVAVCFMITVQCVFGYALGFLALRTRSIVVGSAFHAIADATSII